MNDFYLFVFTKIASSEGFIVAAILIFAFLIYQKRQTEALLFLATTSFLMASVEILKNVFGVPRPPEPLIEVTGYAFPSGHATGSIFLALSIIFLTQNTSPVLRYSTWITVTVLTLLIGASRIQLGVHTPTQIAAGYILGCLSMFVFLVARKKLLHKNNLTT